MDRRIHRTRKALRDAMLALVIEKGYDAVSIEDITEKAEMARATFYLHYRGKEDLLLDCLQNMLDDVNRIISEIIETGLQTTDETKANNSLKPVLFAFQYASEHVALYHALMKGEGSAVAAPIIQQILFDGSLKLFETALAQEARPQLSRGQMELLAAYFGQSLLGMISWWIDNGMKYTPEEMAEFFCQVFFNGARNHFGLPSVLLEQFAGTLSVTA